MYGLLTVIVVVPCIVCDLSYCDVCRFLIVAQYVVIVAFHVEVCRKVNALPNISKLMRAIVLHTPLRMSRRIQQALGER